MLPLGASIVGKTTDYKHPNRQCDEAGHTSSRPASFRPQRLHNKNATQSQDDKGEQVDPSGYGVRHVRNADPFEMSALSSHPCWPKPRRARPQWRRQRKVWIWRSTRRSQMARTGWVPAVRSSGYSNRDLLSRADRLRTLDRSPAATERFPHGPAKRAGGTGNYHRGKTTGSSRDARRRSLERQEGTQPDVSRIYPRVLSPVSEHSHHECCGKCPIKCRGTPASAMRTQ